MSRSFGPYSMYDQHMSAQGSMFASFDDSMMARVDALAELKPPQQLFKHDIYSAPDMAGYGPAAKMHPMHMDFSHGDSMVEQMNAIGGPNGFMMAPELHAQQQMYANLCAHPVTQQPPPQPQQQQHSHQLHGHLHVSAMQYHHHHHGGGGGGMPMKSAAAAAAAAASAVLPPDGSLDPRELEAFAERFKQRRIKLGVTQADVGRALGNLKIAGIGSLSQSTICRFESLTLSHNNMIALKPVLLAWLEEAERVAREKRSGYGVDAQGAALEKKRKRTSIAAPEKRSLEAYFAIQPRPSGDKISQIAEKLDLKKNVVRVWFCNQRQKQKRMKFASISAGGSGGGVTSVSSTGRH